MLILLAGLQSQPGDVARGGARSTAPTAVQIFRYMTLPHLRQYIELGALLGSIYIVQNFDAVFTITPGGRVGTANLPYTIYQTMSPQAHEYGLASAAGVVVVIGTIIVATFALRTDVVAVQRGGVPMSTTADTARNPFAPDDRRRQRRRRRKVKDDAPPPRARLGDPGLGARRCCSSCRSLWMVLTSLHQRDRRRDQPAVDLRAADPGRTTRTFFDRGVSPGRR